MTDEDESTNPGIHRQNRKAAAHDPASRNTQWEGYQPQGGPFTKIGAVNKCAGAGFLGLSSQSPDRGIDFATRFAVDKLQGVAVIGNR